MERNNTNTINILIELIKNKLRGKEKNVKTLEFLGKKSF